MITVPDREVSLLQSELARQADGGKELDAGGLEVKFGTGFGGGDWFGWIRSLFDHVDRSRRTRWCGRRRRRRRRFPIAREDRDDRRLGHRPLRRAEDRRADRKTAAFELLMHLGDVYYSGTEEEVQERFLDMWPRRRRQAHSRALNSNHEMYSGGFGYFELALPAIGQKSSYFAFENEHWLLVGLDTAYVDHDMDNEQVAWLNLVIEASQARRTAAGEETGAVLAPAAVLAARQPGPEAAEGAAASAGRAGDHRLVLGPRAPVRHLRPASATTACSAAASATAAFPKCAKSEVKNAPTEQTVGGVMWKRNVGDRATARRVWPSTDRTPTSKGEEEKFVPHGYMTLELNGPDARSSGSIWRMAQEILKNQVG